jgi:ribosomal protein L11 methyltransferase
MAAAERGSLLDAGCGSGVLAVAAARLGFAPVTAVDVDEVAVGVARQTVRRNRVAVTVRRADVLADELPAVDVVVANVALAAVQALLRHIAARVAITSGYPAHESPTAPGWRREARVELEGWAADAFRAPALS